MGTESSGSLRIAHAALSEVKSCLDDPWLQALYDAAPERRRVESPVECAHEQSTLYSGVIDLAAEIDGKWNLVDFKTSTPLEGEPAEDFFRRESEAYRPQILGYCEIWAKLTGTDQKRLNAFIYWTALRKNTKVLL
jgi:ATP-dependent exoDNAse (exonuclease V) beta subunit